MPTTRRRSTRVNKVALTPEVVELFREWKELDDRKGSRSTREGILLTEDEENRYYSLSRKIESQVILEKKRPWDTSHVCYSMWGKNEHPTAETFKNFSSYDLWDEYWERAVKMRLQLEEMVKTQ